MGKGGDQPVHIEKKFRLQRAPSEKPPFTVGDLKRAIPAHCFVRSTAVSAAYLAADLAIIAMLAYATRFFDLPAVPRILAYGLLWPLYWVVQGCVATGVWVIAHECGHQAFSDSGLVNDTVGMVLHTGLLVPYFSWKYSHRRHHSNTGSTSRDEVFVPLRDEEVVDLVQFPLIRIGFIFFTLTIGWYMYLFINATGRKYDRFSNHFDPTSLIFNSRERFFVVVSDIGLVAALAGLYGLGSTYGFLWLVKVYVIPLMVVNFWLVLITLLQHTHPALPHYSDAEWDWLRGALATVDRDYGILNTVFHHIADTHVAHHLFSTMPHYHAMEATEAIKPILGQYYQFDRTPIWRALWREVRECQFVEPDTADSGVLWYGSKLKAVKSQ